MPLSENGTEITDFGIFDYITQATSDNTRMAYQSDIRHFLKEGGMLPATPESIESYLIKRGACEWLFSLFFD